MTKPEYTFIRNNYFSLWIRENLPDSSTGFVVSDIDIILYDWNLKKIMLLEVKLKNKQIEKWQINLFNNLHKWISKGICDSWQYLGFHSVIFENTNFIDGKVFFDNKEIIEEELKEKLSFGKFRIKKIINNNWNEKGEWINSSPPITPDDIEKYNLKYS